MVTVSGTMVVGMLASGGGKGGAAGADTDAVATTLGTLAAAATGAERFAAQPDFPRN